MPLTLVSPPIEEPVSLTEVKLHLRLVLDEAGAAAYTDEDATLSGLIAAARQHLDGRNGILGRALVSQTWALTRDDLPATGIRLPLAPVASVTSVEYVDGDGVTQTLAADQYVLSGDRVLPAYDATWPTPRAQVDAATVTFVAGYGSAAAVPQPLRQAILLMVGYWYEQRSAVNVGNIVNEMPLAVDALTAPYRVHSFG